MSSLPRETLEAISSLSEWLGAIFGVLAATSVILYVLVNKPLRKFEAHDNETLQDKVAEAQRALLEQKERADDAAGKLAGLEEAAATAKGEMAKQQTRAATAERALLELQTKVKSRHLSPEQAGKISAFLLTAPPGSVEVQMSLGVEDGAPFCTELAWAIAKGGWKAKFDTQTAMYGQLRDIALIMKDVNSPPHSTKALQDALKQINIQALAYPDPSLGKDALILLVAPKER